MSADRMDGVGAALHWGIEIPLRQGSRLSATLYTPAGRTPPWPCILMMTPYIADGLHSWGAYFAEHGLACALVDVRGRGNSGGVFHPNLHEAKDGYDVVEWLACQPFCNGKVAMCGGSYLGAAQWSTAGEFPPHLITIVPAASPCLGVDFPMRNNIFYPYLIQWLMLTSGRASQRVIFADFSRWADLFRRWSVSGRSLRELDRFAGNPSAVFQEWLDHPCRGPYWDAYSPTPAAYARMELPVLTITGAYDDDQPGALEHYRRHTSAASPAARAGHYLVIGPWDHAGSTGSPRAKFGGIECGPESLLDLMKLHLEWYAWTLQSGPRPALLRKRVAYYHIGAEEWRYADSLEAITERYDPQYLGSRSHATDVFCSGVLQGNPGTGGPDAYTYDPRKNAGAEAAAAAAVAVGSLTDQTMVMIFNGRQLVYHGAPLEHDTDISGFFRLSAWLAIDCPDTDLYATVYEIGLEGQSVRLTTDAVRARYRESLHTSRLIDSPEALLYEFERFTFVSRRIRQGHRLRLVIGPHGCLIDSAFCERNYNGGGAVADETAREGRPVTVQLFHDPKHPSVLHVPVGRCLHQGDVEATTS